MIARDLYRLVQEVEKLEKQLENSPLEKREEIKDHLRKQRAELKKMQRMLDGAKEQPPWKKPI
jgi:hypothetical protein